MSIRVAVFLCGLVLLVSSTMSYAAIPPHSKTATSAPRTYALSPFTGTVPRGYLGHDPRGIYRALEKTKPRDKSEFETTAQFEHRVAQSADRPLYGTLRSSSTLAFVFPSREATMSGGENDPINLTLSYHADSQKMTAKITFNPMHLDGDDYAEMLRSIVWNDVSVRTRSYVGSNAFGVTRQIDEIMRVTTGLAFDVSSPFYDVGADGFGEMFAAPRIVSLSASAENAKLLKKNLRLLIIAKLMSPYFIETQKHTEPTIDDPYDQTQIYHYLRVQIQDIWLFDIVTRAVAKIPHIN